MVLYLTEGLLTEAVSGDEVIKAIDNRNGVLITYNDEKSGRTGTRYIEPYVYGVTSRNNPAIRAYQYYGDTNTGTPAWKLLRLDRIESWQPTGNKFDLEPQARGWAAEAFNGNDRMLPTIYNVVELGEEPLTDLEKLRVRTKQIKQSQPVNINQIQKKTPVETKPQEKQSGPVGTNKPEMGAENPLQPTPTNQGSKPLNTNGTVKNDTTQPPVRQEPKQSGPVVSNPQDLQVVKIDNPQEKSPDELMSNDQFRDMLKRNLERTDREKQKRGFSLSNKL